MTTISIITIAFIGLTAFAAGKGRKDVVLAVGGYAFAALIITILLFFGCLYLYTLFVHHLWTTGMG